MPLKSYSINKHSATSKPGQLFCHVNRKNKYMIHHSEVVQKYHVERVGWVLRKDETRVIQK